MGERQVWMFGGQGSQTYHMGADLYASEPVFRECMDRCSEMIRGRLGLFLPDVLYASGRGRGDTFDAILLTHPALFIFQYSVAQTLRARGLRPDVLLGYSLGELVCFVDAGAMGLADGLNLVVSQAERIRDCCPPGGMTAVLAPLERLAAYRDEHLPAVAAVNYREHFVLSGGETTLARVEERLRRDEVIFVRLPVRHAFHSPAMDPAREPLLADARRIPCGREASCRIASSCTAELVSAWTPDHAFRVAREPVRFADTLARLEREGPNRYLDLGPSGTLANFVKYGIPGARSAVHAVFNPFGGGAQLPSRAAAACG